MSFIDRTLDEWIELRSVARMSRLFIRDQRAGRRWDNDRMLNLSADIDAALEASNRTLEIMKTETEVGV